MTKDTDKYPYEPVKAIKCAFFGHHWMSYDINRDKCLHCNKEKQVSWFENRR